jgi:hypothetical protein
VGVVAGLTAAALAAGDEYAGGAEGIAAFDPRMVFRLLLAAKVPTLQLSECGVKLTLSPRMEETSLPFTLVEPEPRSVLSGATPSRKAPPAL